MKIAVLGGSGMAGAAVFAEARQRGHQPVAFVRDKGRALGILGSQATIIAKDVFALTRDDLAGFEAIVVATAFPPERAYLHIDLATRLVAMFRATETPRLLFILGAGSLVAPTGHLLLDDMVKDPANAVFINIPIAAYRELLFLKNTDNVNWVGVSPSAVFAKGQAHMPKIGNDNLLFAEDGKSHVTDKTMAVAILDELEHPEFKRRRFTVSD